MMTPERNPACAELAEIEDALEKAIRSSPYFPSGQSWHPDLTLRSACRSDALAGLYGAFRMVQARRIALGDAP